MLQKKYRLKKYSAFNATYKIKDTASDGNICMFFGKQKPKDDITTKIAFVVSKKIHKRAVVRNRIKRLMRESFRLIIKNNEYNGLNKYLSIICVARNNAIGADFKTIDMSVKNILSKKLN
ncbi:ribonuclease P protein component [bacterium]|nr:ribonuclease P protein component [bacterium]